MPLSGLQGVQTQLLGQEGPCPGPWGGCHSWLKAGQALQDTALICHFWVDVSALSEGWGPMGPSFRGHPERAAQPRPHSRIFLPPPRHPSFLPSLVPTAMARVPSLKLPSGSSPPGPCIGQVTPCPWPPPPGAGRGRGGTGAAGRPWAPGPSGSACSWPPLCPGPQSFHQPWEGASMRHRRGERGRRGRPGAEPGLPLTLRPRRPPSPPTAL